MDENAVWGFLLGCIFASMVMAMGTFMHDVENTYAEEQPETEEKVILIIGKKGRLTDLSNHCDNYNQPTCFKQIKCEKNQWVCEK